MFLYLRGWEVTGVDFSSEMLSNLEKFEKSYRDQIHKSIGKLGKLHTVCLNIERDEDSLVDLLPKVLSCLFFGNDSESHRST